MTKEFLKEELRRVANMMQDPGHFSKHECIITLHSVLEQIPEWKDASILPPACPLMDVYDNYDNILIGSMSDQFFTLVYDDGTPVFKNGENCVIPYIVAEMGMKRYFDYSTTVEIDKLERPSFKPAKVRLGFKKLDPEAQLPKYAHEGDAGMDVFALEDTYLYYGTSRIVRTGIAAEIPDGYELQVRARSGLAVKGVEVVNGPGTVDSKYRGEIGVILRYINWVDDQIYNSRGEHIASGRKPGRGYEIKKGDKIAQLVLAPVTFAEPFEVQELSETDRGTGGFGSTGR